jgi:hypothetical protein
MIRILRISITAAVAMALLSLGAAWAARGNDGEAGGARGKQGQPGEGRGRGEGEPGEHRGPGEGRRAHPAYGKITAINGNSITIEPRRPDWAKEPPRGEREDGQQGGGEGRQRPPMPESITFTVNADTKYGVNGAKGGSLSDFAVGDVIGVRLEGDVRSGEGVALAMLDDQSAKKLFEQMGPDGKGARGEGGPGKGARGEGGPRGKGERGEGGPGGKGQRGPRPMFGVITSVDSNTITIKPEIPDFIKQQMEQRRGQGGEGGGRGEGGPGGQGGGRGEGGGPGGHDGPRELPAQITASLDGQTFYFQNNTAVDRNPYQVGDRVAIMPGERSTRENVSAHAVMDYATAQAKLKQHMQERGQGKAGKGKAGKGKGKAGKGKNKSGKGKQQGQSA